MLDLLFGKSGSRKRAGGDGWSGAQNFRIGRMSTLAGPIVDEDLALTLSAVWACTRLYAETTACLPLHVYERTSGDDRRVASELPLYDVLHSRPNPDMGDTPFREGRTMHQTNWGNGFAEIERNMDGQVLNLWPIHPSRVYPASPAEQRRGIEYKVRNNSGEPTDLAAGEMLHIPGTLSEDGKWGKGVIQHARESIGFGLSTERHGAAYFASGAQPKGFLTAPGMKNKEDRQALRGEWKEVHYSPDSSEIAIFPLGSTFTPITISNEDNQFLETRKFNGIIICQWYQTPPHMIGLLDKATFSNIEHQQLEFVMFKLFPTVRRQESQYNLKLLTPEERKRYYVEHNLNGLLRGDLTTRMAAYVHAIQNGIMTINECRRLENLNSIGPAGDQHYVQLNMTTAERMMKEPDPKKINTAQAAVGDIRRLLAPDAVALPQYPSTDELKQPLAEALERMFRKEANAVRRAIRNKSLDFAAWLNSFHDRHAVVLREAIQPGCRALRTAIDVDEAALVDACLIGSRDQLTKAFNKDTPEAMQARLDTWSDDRTACTLKRVLGDQ